MAGRADREVQVLDRSGVAAVADDPAKIVALFRRQAEDCERGGSPLYAGLLDRLAAEAEARGPVWQVLGQFDGDRGHALPLRFMRAVHRLVLTGRAPDLARFFPSAGGTAEGDPWPALAELVDGHGEELIASTRPLCQTNEVGRAAALLPGFLLLARRALPFRTLELGASAGLLLWWDRFRYQQPELAWGDAASPVELSTGYEPPLPQLEGQVVVEERRGCDPNPLDPSDSEHRLQLMSSVWADQLDRFSALEGAITIAESEDRRVDRAGGVEWLPQRLAERPSGVLTIVYHTVTLPYMSDDERAELPGLLAEAGERATDDAPLAWLRMEPYGWPDPYPHQVWLQTWPGGEERILARSGAHGRPVWWTSNDPGSGRGPSAGPILASR